jgi:hypothetical protein
MGLEKGGEAEMKRMVALLTMATLIATFMLAAGTVSAQEEAVTLEVGPSARVIGGGQALLVTIEVTCEPNLQVLEANVFVQQGATSVLAGIGSVECDGTPHTHKVKVSALDGQFSRGEANVSAFVLLLDASTGMTVQGQDARTVSVVGGPR